MIHILPATSLTDYNCISELAQIIWHEHYIKIISLEQIDYMLEKYNSVKSIEKRAQEGVLFYYMTYNNVPAGYIAIEKEATLEDLHNTIVNAFGFDGSEMASFYTCDDEWNQGEEISLFDVSEGGTDIQLMSQVIELFLKYFFS